MSDPSTADPAPTDDYQASVDRWHQGRLDRLRAPAGWLSLVDRLLLEPGENHLPIGTATLTEDQTVHFRAHPQATVLLEGAPVTERILRADAGGPPDRLESGGRSYELIRRGPAFAIRVKDPRSALLQQFTTIARYPVDPRFRVVARFEPYDPPRITRMSFDMGEGDPRTVPGVARFQLDGHALALEPIIEPSSQRLFFVFGDLTNRAGDTYPGGRFLYADPPAAADLAGAPAQVVVLDFNLAFNPPCALTEFATCPAIPAGNRLPLAVLAGERRYHPPVGH
jgi:uncharacterized protein